MKNFKDIILEKLKVTPNNTGEFHEFKIQTIGSASPVVLNIMLRDIDFHMFNYENYINNVLDSDIAIYSVDLKEARLLKKVMKTYHLMKIIL